MTIIVVTALLSSAFTLIFAYALYKVVFEKQLDRYVDELAEEFQKRVHDGAIDAGEELMPEFRDNVKEGFTEAISSISTVGVVENTAKGVAKTGADIVGEGLNTLLGRRR